MKVELKRACINCHFGELVEGKRVQYFCKHFKQIVKRGHEEFLPCCPFTCKLYGDLVVTLPDGRTKLYKYHEYFETIITPAQNRIRGVKEESKAIQVKVEKLEREIKNYWHKERQIIMTAEKELNYRESEMRDPYRSEYDCREDYSCANCYFSPCPFKLLHYNISMVCDAYKPNPEMERRDAIKISTANRNIMKSEGFIK